MEFKTEYLTNFGKYFAKSLQPEVMLIWNRLNFLKAVADLTAKFYEEKKKEGADGLTDLQEKIVGKFKVSLENRNKLLETAWKAFDEKINKGDVTFDDLVPTFIPETFAALKKTFTKNELFCLYTLYGQEAKNKEIPEEEADLSRCLALIQWYITDDARTLEYLVGYYGLIVWSIENPSSEILNKFNVVGVFKRLVKAYAKYVPEKDDDYMACEVLELMWYWVGWHEGAFDKKTTDDILKLVDFVAQFIHGLLDDAERPKDIYESARLLVETVTFLLAKLPADYEADKNTAIKIVNLYKRLHGDTQDKLKDKPERSSTEFLLHISKNMPLMARLFNETKNVITRFVGLVIDLLDAHDDEAFDKSVIVEALYKDGAMDFFYHIIFKLKFDKFKEEDLPALYEVFDDSVYCAAALAAYLPDKARLVFKKEKLIEFFGYDLSFNAVIGGCKLVKACGYHLKATDLCKVLRVYLSKERKEQKGSLHADVLLNICTLLDGCINDFLEKNRYATNLDCKVKKEIMPILGSEFKDHKGSTFTYKEVRALVKDMKEKLEEFHWDDTENEASGYDEVPSVSGSDYSLDESDYAPEYSAEEYSAVYSDY